MIRQKALCGEFKLRGWATLAISATLAAFLGCNHPAPSDQQLQQRAAQTTQQVKQGAQQVAAGARAAAGNATRQVDAIAAGVKQGLRQPASGSTAVIDINSASAAQLATLPGISDARAKRIVDHRPYTSPHDLVGKGIISEAEYSRLSGRIVAD
ncbi:MAG TPA: helix-hairpin-helix domain-containing protein [Silvibacterium sp.]|nr:helix-hairpin-helix domain-containing protein [Silvibacterium sp.]